MRKFIAYLAIFVAIVLVVPVVSILDFTNFLQDGSSDISNATTSQAEDIDDLSSQNSSDTTLDTQSEEDMSSAVEDEESSDDSTVANTLIKVYNHKTAQVQEMNILDYIIGVVCAEIPVSYEEQAIKAQAIIAHTYTLRIMANEINSPTAELMGANISTDPAHHQAYYSDEEIRTRFGDNYDEYYTKISENVKDVIDKVITYNDEPILATFHATSSGVTEDAINVWGQKVPYLIPTISPENTDSENFQSTYTFTPEQVQTIISASHPHLNFAADKRTWLSVLSRTTSDYVGTVSVLGEVIPGQEFRSMFELKSANFTISYENDLFTIITKVYGHGVGLSQSGANLMAQEGSTYNEILAHYYPGTIISDIQ